MSTEATTAAPSPYFHTVDEFQRPSRQRVRNFHLHVVANPLVQGNCVLMLDLAVHQRSGNGWDVVRSDGEGAECVGDGSLPGFGGPPDRTQQAARIAGHTYHRHLCRHLRADSWVHVEMFSKSKEEWFRSFLDLPNGIPSHDTFGEVFSRLDPDWFQECFMEWSRAVAGLLPGEVVAIDGKPVLIEAEGTVRRSHDKRTGKQAIHLVSAWASANALSLGHVKTDQKSNEITAIPRLLELLELNGCSVTIDAMGCQKEIAQGILDRGADYLLAVKENQGRLYQDVRDLFDGAEELGWEGAPYDYATTLNPPR